MAKNPKIDKRDDVNPGEGEHKYGDVDGPAIRFADPTNKKYPIDTAEHVRAACSYGTGRPDQPQRQRGQIRRRRGEDDQRPH